METNFDNICRICMKEDDNFVNLSTVDEDFVEYSSKLYFCVPTVQIDDTNFPQQLCPACIGDLKITYRLKTKCLDSTQKIKSILNAKSFNNIPNNVVVKDIVSNLNLQSEPHFVSVSDCNDKNHTVTNEEPEKKLSNDQEDEEDESGEEDGNIEDILTDKFGSDIEESYDDDHSYYLRTNKDQIQNETYNEIENHINIKVEIEENIEEEAMADDELRDSVFTQIFHNKPIHLDDSLADQKTLENNEISIVDDDNSIKISKDNEEESLTDPIFLNIPVQIDMDVSQRYSLRNNISKYPFFCTICNVGFQEDSFTEHREMHTDKEIIICPSCKREFYSSNIKLFFRHYCPRHKWPFLVTCMICYRKFKSPQALANHRKVHNKANREYFCHLCDTYFATSQKLDWHNRNGIHTDKVTKKLRRY